MTPEVPPTDRSWLRMESIGTPWPAVIAALEAVAAGLTILTVVLSVYATVLAVIL